MEQGGIGDWVHQGTGEEDQVDPVLAGSPGAKHPEVRAGGNGDERIGVESALGLGRCPIGQKAPADESNEREGTGDGPNAAETVQEGRAQRGVRVNIDAI
jgi:hypothetical protein